MSYQVLARKWRPAQFDQVVGQSHVLKPLQHALDNQRLHHAYLFTGTRGVGKTTIARILAKALNCEQGITATPCGQCEACQEIDQGRFVDLLEIDAASRTKVEDTRELLDNVQYRPTRGRYKVYLIDEVHMLSRHSFNALLKTLEEPPEHVKFLLATTDPQKLPVTVVSRCLQFNLRALTADLITQQLQYVLQQEQVSFDQSAITALAKSAKGSMRDGLSLTDQAIAQGAGSVEQASVEQMLGNVPSTDVLGLLEDICNNDANKLFQRFAELVGLVPSVTAILDELQTLLHRLALVQVLPELASSDEQNEQFKRLLRKLPAEVIQLYYRIVVEGRKEQPFAVDDRAAVEMTLLRLLAFKPLTPAPDKGQQRPVDTVVEQHDAVSVPESELTPEPQPQPTPESDPGLPPEPEPQSVDTVAPAEPSSDRISDSGSNELNDLLKMREQLAAGSNADSDTPSSAVSEEPAPEPEKKNLTANEPETTSAQASINTESLAGQLPELNEQVTSADQVDDWSALIAAMNVSGLARQLLLNSNLVKQAENDWRVAVASEQQSLISEATVNTVVQALQDSLNQQGKFSVTVEEPQQPTPLMIQQHINVYRQQLAVEWVQQDPAVNELQQRFAATLDESTIKAV